MKYIVYFILLFLTGCSQKCKQHNFFESGYQEHNLNDNEFILTFQEGIVSAMLYATPAKDQDRVLAMRAAELTLENGFNYFDIRRGQTQNTLHIYCYNEEKTNTSIDAAAFLQRYSKTPAMKEQMFEITKKGDI